MGRPMLHAYDEVWPLIEDLCPCDVHFVEFLEAERIENASVFHFGIGAHHHVGIRTAENGSGNAVLGITASRGVQGLHRLGDHQAVRDAGSRERASFRPRE